MKTTRKGFTLVELLIVIGIMGILGGMAMIGGQEATDAAKATNIADNLEKASIAMMSYYADNSTAIDKNGAKIADVKKGAQAYLKSNMLTEGTAGTASTTKGDYSVVLVTEDDATAKWFVAYTLFDQEANGNVAKILENKATRLQLKKDATASPAAYDGGATVFMLVR